jgi:hypothetical protein
MGQYPGRDEHQGSRPRCKWCGRIYDTHVQDPFNEIQYCSFTCRMAGMFYRGIGLSSIMTAISLLATYLILVLALEMPYGYVFVPLFWVVTICLWYGVYVGYKVRSARKSVDRFSDDEEVQTD